MVDFLGKYLILETVEQQLTDAIKNHQTVSLYYKGYKGTPNPKTGKKMGRTEDFTDAGLRYVIPVALGLHKSSGSMVVRALVTSKGVHTKGRERPTKWRMFRVDRITSVYPHEDPKAINDAMPELYQTDDKDMSIIYAQADYKNQQAAGTTPVQTPITGAQEPKPQKMALGKVPDNAKSVLKVPQAPAQPKPVAQPPVQASHTPAQQKPITPPKGKQEIKPETPPVPAEPESPNEPNQQKPLSEWYRWLNKIVNN